MRPFVVLALLGGGIWCVVRQALGGQLKLAVGLLLVPGLLLGAQEGDLQVQEGRLTAASRVLSGRDDVVVHCQRLSGAWFDATAELGYVRFDAEDAPDRVAHLEWDACRSLVAYLHSDRADPPLDQVVAVHVLAHEAQHLAGVRTEWVAECRSMARTALTARMLGASPAQADALAATYVREVYPHLREEYVSTRCAA